jgi:hypothetical protein
LSDKTKYLDEGDFFHFGKITCIANYCDQKKIIARTHDHRGQLVILKDGRCIMEKIAWYASKV